MFIFFKKTRLNKVLVGCNHLNDLGGSEIYTYTLIKSLSVLGWDVSFTTFHEGTVSEKCKEFATFIDPTNISEHLFYKAIISHHSIVRLPINAIEVIQVCHGTLPRLEQPSFLADHHISVSLGVYDHLNKCGVKSSIVNNLIDFSRFYIKREINDKPKRVLSLCQGEEADKNVEDACRILEIEFDSLSKTRVAIWNLEDRIMKADIVVSYGRGIFEAMACGRNAIVYDSRGYIPNQGDGMVTEANFDSFLSLNCTGQINCIDFTKDLLVEEIKKYDPAQGGINHRIAKNKFDSIILTRKILSIPIKNSGIMKRCQKFLRRNKKRSLFARVIVQLIRLMMRFVQCLRKVI